MGAELEEILMETVAKTLAQELILVDLIHDAWPLEQHRAERRDSTCRALEEAIARTDPASHEHLHLQRVLHAVEALFGSSGPRLL